MARVRVKVPGEPKIIEMPAHLVNESQPLVEVPQVPQTAPIDPVPQAQPIVETIQAPTTATPNEVQKTGITFSKKSLLLMGASTLIMVLFITGIFISKNNNSETPKTLGASTSQSEPQAYYDIVSKYVDLPTEELPTVANVSEADKVKQQSTVLTDVKNGDKMLFFAKSRKVIVYRPSNQKIVAVVSLSSPDAATSSTSN